MHEELKYISVQLQYDLPVSCLCSVWADLVSKSLSFCQRPPYPFVITCAHLANRLLCVACACTRTQVKKITFGGPPARKLSLLNTKSHLTQYCECVHRGFTVDMNG